MPFYKFFFPCISFSPTNKLSNLNSNFFYGGNKKQFFVILESYDKKVPCANGLLAARGYSCEVGGGKMIKVEIGRDKAQSYDPWYLKFPFSKCNKC